MAKWTYEVEAETEQEAEDRLAVGDCKLISGSKREVRYYVMYSEKGESEFALVTKEQLAEGGGQAVVVHREDPEDHWKFDITTGAACGHDLGALNRLIKSLIPGYKS